MAEALTVDQALELFNRIAPEHGAKPRKQFRNRAAAEAAFSSIKVAMPHWENGAAGKPKAQANGKPKAQVNGKPKSAPQPRPKKVAAEQTGRAIIDASDDKLLAAFQALRGSNHAKVLKKLEAAGGQPVPMEELEKVTGTGRSAVLMTIGGLIKKTEGKSLRGKPRPKYKIVKTRTDDDKKELQIALQAE
jgi:hypothetical protein